jgi:hypothetical protein
MSADVLLSTGSIKAGPLRLNLSRSGIGVSAGIPGLRIGTGPRGSYVRMSAGGVSCQYGQVVLRAVSGLHIVWSFSRVDAAQLLANAVSAMRVNGGATLR